ncbi:hypothetical protein NEUTE1DRAFT_100021 [Neurospora tetrasperma FGSC 2508]|uniref:Uncharacterized protein n=1 Tax=Neurospora tetrasperma (strain FGSC 2508 / ATCC MYA-4615 / P0657) TaxID=510951 RepID=F8MIX7_NEUT8|nr:uncharacterized protein NEUTE1DRAFT_100021 [Neurospora tetrasperma FGSC 2508]EGO59874.1 hypothetical protein NEUTE1DRAFT_100021 [Neurospora tetrasperma FGSC 2508]EGZ74023.1 hypothetical protein NEUTE2DRAFT_128375 [Neurospora tetrasperma FGSC 2509]
MLTSLMVELRLSFDTHADGLIRRSDGTIAGLPQSGYLMFRGTSTAGGVHGPLRTAPCDDLVAHSAPAEVSKRA